MRYHLCQATFDGGFSMIYSRIREKCTHALCVGFRTSFVLLILALLSAGCERPVTLHAPTESLFVGSYAKIPVTIPANSGLTMDDLDFVVPAGPKGGQISLSHDESFDPQNPDVMLLAGYELGTYQLQAIEKSTSDVLDEVVHAHDQMAERPGGSVAVGVR